MIPCVTYLRVSTEEQTVENQRAYLEDWAARHGFHIVRHYAEHAVSGYTSVLKRLEFRRLVRDVEGGRLSPRPVALLVFEVSRLVRNFTEFFRLLDLVEGRLGLLIVSASEKEAAIFQMDTAMRQFLRSILAFVAHMEREFIRQRTRAALERARREGRLRYKWRQLLDSHGLEIGHAYTNGVSMTKLAEQYGVSIGVIKRVLTRLGLYNAPPHICPRCFARMEVTSRDFRLDRRVLVESWYCHNCGHETHLTRGF